jgi:glyceraldehyde 3-phosphate dehydrogenase
MMRVAINGFGRIGRCFLRAILENGQKEFAEVAAINSPGNPRTLAHLLKHDSTYGILPMDVGWEADSVLIEDCKIPCINETDPARIDWTAFNVDLVLESSGKATERDTARAHLSSGARRVLVSAPSRNADVTLIPGCNLETYNPSEHRVVSMGSCTLNCLGPILKVILKNYGVKSGFATAIHSYTNDQSLLDGSHEDLRRARAAGQSLIPTKTGASLTLAQVFPELKGKIFCAAIRAPTSIVSLLDLVVQAETETDDHSVNQAYQEASKNELSVSWPFPANP